MERSRGQTSPLAVVLLVAIVITGATTVVVFGGGLVDSLSTTADTERAGQEMSHLASESAAVALGGSQQRRVTFDASGGKLTVDDEASWICVRNGSTSDREFILPESGAPDESCGESKTYMGTVFYGTGDGTVAYEGGGVWTHGDEGSSRMVSPPEFHYRESTLTLPVVTVEGELNAGGSEVELTAEAGETERVDGISNPLNGSSGRVYVTVHSDYYEAWGEFIADRTDGEVVELDHDDRTVTVELVVPSPPTVENAIYASSNGGNAATVDSGLVDSYDSSESPPRYEPPDHNGSSGSVVTDGGLSLEDTVRGNVYSVRQGGKISVDSGTVRGDVHGQQRVKLDGSEVTGSVYADENVTLDSSSVDGDIHTQDAVDLDTVDVDGDIYADDGLVLDDDDGAVDVAGEVHTSGSATIDSARFGDTVYVEGNVTADEAHFENEVHVTGALKQADESSFDDDIYVDGDVGKLAGSDGDPTDVEGSVHVTGDAEISELTITGDLHVGGELICDGESEVQGDLYVDDAQTTSECPSSDGAPSPTLPDASDAPDATETPDEPVVDPPAVELPPEDEFEELPDDCHANGNPDNEAIIIDDGRTCELDPGEYNVSQVSVDSGTLDISTESGGKVELYAGGDVSISESANVETGDAGHHNATEFEMNVYDEEASVSLSSNVTGVVNAPGTKVDIDDGANVFGAVIADKVQTDGGGGVHYDEALSGMTVGDGQGEVPTVRYLHVTTNEIEFEE